MRGHLKLSTKILYGAGVSYAIVDQIFAQWILYFYLPPANSGLKIIIPPIMLSIALALSRSVDVITDPLVGYLSDRTSTRWGRRIPYIAVGTIPLAVATVAFFYPPLGSEVVTFIYLTVVGSLFFTFYTVVGGPYNSLIPEIGQDKDERLSLSTWQSVFRLLYSALAMIAPGILIKILGKGDTLQGVRGMVITLSVLSVIGAFFTVFGVPEKKLSVGGVSKADFKSTLKIVLKDSSFIHYLFGLLFYFVGFNNLRAVMNYYVEDVMGQGKGGITLAAVMLFGVAALFFIPTVKLSKKIGYRKVMLACLLVLSFLSIVLFNLGKIIPASYGYAIFALIGIPVSGSAFIFPPAMLSEIGTRISQRSGERIEGVCFGIQGFFLKMAFLISIFILPIVLASGGEGVVTNRGIYNSSLFSAISFLISFIFYFKYKE
ncbi:MAG: MFS transporter [Fusobacteriaceae bacterium]